jgi:hypothetical protein
MDLSNVTNITSELSGSFFWIMGVASFVLKNVVKLELCHTSEENVSFSTAMS